MPTETSSLSLYVLLPATSSSAPSPNHVGSRPSPLVSRRSGSTVPSLRSINSLATPSTGSHDETPEIDKPVSPGRRLSLAPGLGTGTQSQPLGPAPTTGGAISGDDAKPSFGTKSASRGRRRPQTAVSPSTSRASTLVPLARGNIAVPRVMGKQRPGWEGDEIVGVLRGSGLEVTIIRNSSQLPAILSPPSFATFNQQPITARPSTPTPLTTVILVPLSDSPTVPSLSLLLQQGTTPTAVVFQQDLLDRAKKLEEEWLPSALEQIRQVIDLKDAMTDTEASPIILAYSANPALSAATIAACVAAGASGVLKPPYDLETAKLVRRIVRAARRGPVSTSRPLSPVEDEESPTKIVLPPTALSMGGEHEAEKVLSSAYRTHRRGTSADQWLPASRDYSRKGSIQYGLSNTLTVTTPQFPEHGEHDDPHFASLLTYNPNIEQRRRSVDTSGLGLALRRAQRAYEIKPSTTMELPSDDDVPDTQFAELVGAMFYQTRLTIDIDMDGYEELSAPISQEHRERLLDAASTWSFKPHFLDDQGLYRLACILFDGVLHSQGLVELQLPRDQVNRLLYAIRAIYHAPNPYHNYVHAIDVLQANYVFLVSLGLAPPYEYIRSLGPDTAPWKRPSESEAGSHASGSRRARQVFRPQDVFAMLIAAMGHDVGHPGLSNAFMKNAKTPLSQVYDDKSVLENMHCMLIVQLLRKHGFSFLVDSRDKSSSARAQFDSKGFRRVLYSSILATDMSLHFAWMGTLQSWGQKIANEGEGYGLDDISPGKTVEESVEGDRLIIAQALIKCADISNPTRPIDVSEHWSNVLLREWAVQASLETDLALPVSVIGSADRALQAKGQIGFIKLFTQPLFDAVSDVLPEMQPFANWCDQNRQIWETRMEKLEDESASAVVQPAVEDALCDERFATLFPLSLPTVLVAPRNLEPGPVTNEPGSPMTSPLRKGKYVDSVKPFDSPSAKAIRAVYRANLLDQRHRLSSWTRGVPVPGLTPSGSGYQRRSSTPASLSAGVS